MEGGGEGREGGREWRKEVEEGGEGREGGREGEEILIIEIVYMYIHDITITIIRRSLDG